jgi:hypothetical protein
MTITVSPTQSQIFIAVGTVLDTFGLVAGDGSMIPVIQGQDNRVPEPTQSDFLVMWPISRDRLALNIDDLQDSIVTGSITANVLTVTHVTRGAVLIGAVVNGVGVTVGCSVTRQVSGTPEGIGIYAVTTTADVTSETMYPGTLTATQKTEVHIQADVHGPASSDNAARISTLWRAQFGVDAFLGAGIDALPLYTTDPRQIPFENGEQQTEECWIVDLCLQANVAITVPQQFADQLIATVDPVDLFVVS